MVQAEKLLAATTQLILVSILIKNELVVPILRLVLMGNKDW